MDEIKFEVGQTVYDSFRFKGLQGTVEGIGSDWVRVKYPPNELTEMVVYRNRKYADTDNFPTLYPFPYEFETKEVQQFKKGDLVLFRNNEGHVWNIGIYRELSEYPDYIHNIRAWGQFETFAKFIIPLKNNEHKLWRH